VGRRLGTALLLLASLALTCGAAEGVLRLAGWVPIYDVYSRPELFWRHDDQLGWSLEPGARGRYRGPRPFPVEFDSEVAINSFGLRGPEPAPRRPGELRVLFLGDSVVAGFEVEQSETFVARVETALRGRFEEGVTAINGGVRGYGTDQSLVWWRSRGLALAPDLVVLVFAANDFDDNVTLHRARRPFGKGAFALRASGSLEPVGVPVPRYPLCSAWVLDAAYEPVRVDGAVSRAACALQTGLADRSALFTAVATALARLPGVLQLLQGAGEDPAVAGASLVPWPGGFARRAGTGGGVARADGAALTTALIQTLAREVRVSGARFLLMITAPHWERLDGRALAADQIEPHAVALPVGLTPAQIRFRNDGHFNAFGHQVYADGLAPLVEAELRAERAARERGEPAAAGLRRRGAGSSPVRPRRARRRAASRRPPR
jgi:lysophospholipase L1-like esterase